MTKRLWSTHAEIPMTFSQLIFVRDAIDQRTEGSQGDTTKRERVELQRVRDRIVRAMQPEMWER